LSCGPTLRSSGPTTAALFACFINIGGAVVGRTAITLGARRKMSIHIPADGSGRNIGSAIATVLAPIVAWAAFAYWRNYSMLVVLAVAIPLAALSLFAVAGRGSWKQVEIATDTITLVGRKRTAVIRRSDIIILELRSQVIVVKWRSEPKAEVAVLGKEHFSSESWGKLCSNLQPWVP
jgi:hypothetical protein